jgi:hypothetical protein
MAGRMVLVACARCKKQFSARVADRNRGWGKFCSKSCKAGEQEQRTGQYAEMVHSQKSRKPLFCPPNVSAEQYLADKKEYGGIPQYNRRGEYEGFRMRQADLSYGGYGDADENTPFGNGKY